jgi:hypothetical protein
MLSKVPSPGGGGLGRGKRTFTDLTPHRRRGVNSGVIAISIEIERKKRVLTCQHPLCILRTGFPAIATGRPADGTR